MSLIHLKKSESNLSKTIDENHYKTSLNDDALVMFQSMTDKKYCPLCRQKAFVYTTCFDCKSPIQWICYTCQWESNLRDHDSCHRNVLMCDDFENSFLHQRKNISQIISKLFYVLVK